MEAETGPSGQEFPSPPVADVVRDPTDDVGPSSLPIEDLADSLVPLSDAKLVGVTQAGMSSSSPLLFQSSACPPSVVCSEPGPSRQLLSDISALNISLPPLDSVILSIPAVSKPPSSPGSIDPSPPYPRPSVSESLPYNLRPRAERRGSGLVVGGLASNPVVIGARKTRGQKSNLSLAQSKAFVDIADGK